MMKIISASSKDIAHFKKPEMKVEVEGECRRVAPKTRMEYKKRLLALSKLAKETPLALEPDPAAGAAGPCCG